MKTRIKHTTTILTNYKGRQTPLILALNEEDPKVFNLPIIYMNYLRKQKLNINSLHSRARSLSLLYDFYLETNPKTLADQRKFVESLLKTLASRSILNWDTYSKNRMGFHIRSIKAFILWVVKHRELATKEELHFTETLWVGLEFSKKLHSSLFYPKLVKNQNFETSKVHRVQKSFPVDKILDLLKVSQHPQEQLIYMLIMFGGRRLCEVLLMLTNDINQNTQKIIVAHPTKSLIDGKTREEYLKEFKLIPRIYEENDMLTGWSRMRFQYPEKLESEVVLIGAIKEYFWQVMDNYMVWRSQFKKSPYLFLDSQGNILKHETLYQWFYRRCLRLKLKVDKDEGVSTLGLRNFYAYYLTRGLELEPAIVQRLLGYHQSTTVQKYLVDSNWEKVI